MSIYLSEVKKHRKANSAWIVIHNDVYDVTKFLNEHPGGADSLLDVAGKDGTQAFEDVGHSDDARKLMKKYKIGSLPAEESIVHVDPCCKAVLTKKPSCPVSGKESCDFKRRASSDRGRRKGKSPGRSERVEPAVSTIIVPRERRRPRQPQPPPPKKSWWWLWILLAMGVAATGAFAYKKYGSAA